MTLTTSQHGAPLVRPNLTTDLVRALVEMIGERSLTPGMKLDSQRDLAAHFGVAVPTMREALRRLEGMGVVDFRHGSGIYVGQNFNRSVIPNIALPEPTTDRLVELIEARALLEPVLAARAAELCDPESVAYLEALVDQAHHHLEHQDERLWKVNIDIHRAIAAAAGNRIIDDVFDSLLSIHAEDQRRILLLHGDPQTDFAEHVEIVRLIAAGNVEEVTDLMRRHLLDVAKAISTTNTA